MANALSADGRVVVGNSYGVINFHYNQAPYRWTQSFGMVAITTSNNSTATGVSLHGSVVVGWGPMPLGAYRWTAGTGAVNLPFLPVSSGLGPQAEAVSSDGNVIVGMNRWNLIPVGAAKWVGNGGPQPLGLLPGGDSSRALAVSADGSVIVGHGTVNTVSSQTRSFRYTSATGMVSLGDTAHSSATGVSADGEVVTGFRRMGAVGEHEVFLWTQKSGVVGLGQPKLGSKSEGLAISPDGTIIVGSAHPVQSREANERLAIIWDADHGMRWLQSVLAAQPGLSSALTGWKLTAAVGVVDSGQYVYFAGNGVNPSGKYEAWWARVPSPLQ